MVREFSKMNLSINQDADWRKLPPPAQHLYMTLWNHPSLNYCGVVDWRPGRLAALSEGWLTEDVEESADCLEARLFVVIDHDTEELLVRSWVRFDGLMKQPRVAVSYANAYASTASNDIRGVIIHEAIKLRKLEPELAGWTKPQVVEMLNLPSIDPRSRSLPDDPFGDGFPHRFGHKVSPDLGETLPNVSGSVSGSRTTATATTTSLQLRATRENAAIPSTDVEDDLKAFDAFWDVYGKKVSRPDAERAWKKAIRKVDAQTLIQAAIAHLAWQKRKGDGSKFIPYAATWLNGERWNDELVDDPASTPPTNKADQRMQANVAVVQQLRAREEAQEQATQQRAIGDGR